MPSSSWVGAGQVQVTDGVDPSIAASVLDYAASNPLAVRLTDTSGNYVAAGGGGGATTIADGADVTQGALADSAATNSTSSWSVIALLKGLFAKLGLGNTSLGTIDTSTAATSAVSGTTAGAAVITDANGTLQQYLRGLVKLAITAGGWLVNIPAIAVSAVVSSVNDQATNATLLSSLATRKGYKFYNDSTQIAYVKEGTTATTADYSYQIQPLGYYESVGLGIYTGRIDCIWAADGSGAMKITELS